MTFTTPCDRFSLIPLGCAKNMVDSEIIAGTLMAAGARFVDSGDSPDWLIITTCAFIESAKQESINTILKAAAEKDANTRLAVVGCLVQRYGEELLAAIPEIDLLVGVNHEHDLPRVLTQHQRRVIMRPRREFTPPGRETTRCLFSSENLYAYLKIADGCSRACRYCIIPRLRGAFHSKPLPYILQEARALTEQGIREINLVSQDTVAYGRDLIPGRDLVTLLEGLDALTGRFYLRLLYLNPAGVTDKLIKAVRDLDKVPPYFDIPIQHISNRVLERMGRQSKERDIRRVLERVRSLIPGATIRTTVMVGFPGETDADFEQLLAFIEQAEFDRLGAFVYSDEPWAKAHRMDNKVPADIAALRRDGIMAAQQRVALRKNRRVIGTIQPAIVGAYEARLLSQAPEIDGVLTLETSVPAGLYRVRVTAAGPYDFHGEVVHAA